MVNICMNVYTQLNEPSLDATSKWFPCLITEPTQDQLVAKDQPILVTHIDCIKHYKHDLAPLLEQTVHCIGSITYDRLKDMGFENVKMHGLVADDIKMNSQTIPNEITWLHGNRYSKDFSKFNGVTAIQTFTTTINKPSISKVVNMSKDITNLFVYSSLVLEELENHDMTNINLHHVASAEPKVYNWKTTTEFYPGKEIPKAPL